MGQPGDIEKQLEQTSATLAKLAVALQPMQTVPSDIRLIQDELRRVNKQVEDINLTLHDPTRPGIVLIIDRLQQDAKRRDRWVNWIGGAAVSSGILWIGLGIFILVKIAGNG